MTALCRHCHRPFVDHHYLSIWDASTIPDDRYPGDPGRIVKKEWSA